MSCPGVGLGICYLVCCANRLIFESKREKKRFVLLKEGIALIALFKRATGVKNFFATGANSYFLKELYIKERTAPALFKRATRGERAKSKRVKDRIPTLSWRPSILSCTGGLTPCPVPEELHPILSCRHSTLSCPGDLASCLVLEA